MSIKNYKKTYPVEFSTMDYQQLSCNCTRRVLYWMSIGIRYCHREFVILHNCYTHHHCRQWERFEENKGHRVNLLGYQLSYHIVPNPLVLDCKKQKNIQTKISYYLLKKSHKVQTSKYIKKIFNPKNDLLDW